MLEATVATAGLPFVIVISAPPGGAATARLTSNTGKLPAGIVDDGFKSTLAIAGTAVSTAVTVRPAYVAEIVVGVEAVTILVGMLNLTKFAPAWTVAVAGT